MSETPPTPPAHRGQPPGRWMLVLAAVLAALALVAGALAVGIHHHDTTAAHKTQDDLRTQLLNSWNTPTPAPSTGKSGKGHKPAKPLTTATTANKGVTPIALMRIPAFGSAWNYAIVESDLDHSATPEIMRTAPAHFRGTAMAGQVGNFVVGGHRAGAYGYFAQLENLKTGDQIVVTTRTDVFTYAVTSREIVWPSQSQVIDPVPDEPGKTPTKAQITLLTCYPYPTFTHRLAVHGLLVSDTKR